MCPTPNQIKNQQNNQVPVMEPRNESEIGLVEKAAEAKPTEDKLPWLSVDNGTLASTAVKLMLSIVVSSSVSTIVFILKKQRHYAEDVMSHIYVSVIMLWVSLMCLIFCRFMLGGMLKGKSQQIKTCFLLGMGLNYFFVFTGVLYASLSWGENEELLFAMLFIGVFNSMVMLMFHETKTKKEEEKRQTMYTHNMFDIPKFVLVEKDQQK